MNIVNIHSIKKTNKNEIMTTKKNKYDIRT